MINFGIKTIVAIGAAATIFLFLETSNFIFTQDNDVVVKKEILVGSTFSVMANQAGVTTTTMQEILSSSQKVYDLSEIVAGKKLAFVYDQHGVLKGLNYEINLDERLEVKKAASTTEEIWLAEKMPIEYTTEIANAKATIQNSLYETVLEQGLDQRLALVLAETFAWQIDFASQIQKGDSFKVIYEQKYRDGEYSHPGKILAAEFINNGEKFQGFYFVGAGTKESLPAEVLTKAGYYDENGNSIQKVFLKAPLQYKYISSGFSYHRFNPILQIYTRHRGIDYAAQFGIPAVSIGDGTVVQAGWNGDYGISVRVRHNEMYTTVYGHFSSLAKGIRVGARVRQGQIIGYVGSTGLSTGPHLHYEMHKFDAFINPFTEKIPAGEPIKDIDQPTFQELRNKYQEQFQKL